MLLQQVSSTLSSRESISVVLGKALQFSDAFDRSVLAGQLAISHKPLVFWSHGVVEACMLEVPTVFHVLVTRWLCSAGVSISPCRTLDASRPAGCLELSPY